MTKLLVLILVNLRNYEHLKNKWESGVFYELERKDQICITTIIDK